MKLSDFDFDLPEALIATRPAKPRPSARLLLAEGDAISDRHVSDLIDILRPGDRLVLNNTRVLPARLFGTRQRGDAVAKVEITLLEPRALGWRALAKPLRKVQPGEVIRFSDRLSATVAAKSEADLTLVFDLTGADFDAALAEAGVMPLPPYIAAKRAADDQDRTDYQTVFARHTGAVAAPTASLHFDQDLLKALAAKGVAFTEVTLHVGAGTFAPIAVDNLDAHPMHAEWYEVPEDTQRRVRQARAEGRPVFAVGTTAVRALESWGLDGAPTGDTRLLIQPGYQWKVVDKLLTNFHLPRSTLLALVMAFAGQERIRAAYAEAIAARYRFFSYGDAMLLG